MREPDTITKLFPIAVGLFAWQLYGWVIGLVVCITYVIVNIALNGLYIWKFIENSEDPVKIFQRFKWILFCVTMIGLAISAAEVVHLK